MPPDLAAGVYGGTGPSIRATVAVLSSCNRDAFAELALRQIARQSFPLPQLEVVVVDDADWNEARLVHRLRSLDIVHRLEWLRPWNNLTASTNFSVAANFHGIRNEQEALTVRLVQLTQRASIGTKRFRRRPPHRRPPHRLRAHRHRHRRPRGRRPHHTSAHS